MLLDYYFALLSVVDFGIRVYIMYWLQHSRSLETAAHGPVRIEKQSNSAVQAAGVLP